MPKKHSRVRLTWEQKRAICKLHHEQPELPVRDLCAWAAKEFALSSLPAPGTLRLLFKSPIQDGGGNPTRKTHHKVQCALLEAEVVQWIDSCEQLRIPVVTGATICEKAAMIRDRIVGDPNSNVTSKLTTMVFSDGWLRKLKLRHGIKSRRLHGEAASANAAAVAEGRVRLQEITRGYDKCDVFNMDETAYFYCMPPDHSHSKNPIAGTKKDKKRITMAVTSNADGSAKTPLLFIGTARQPRCFNGKTGEQLGHQYYSAAKGWMTTSLFQRWVHEFNAVMQTERRNVLLLLDNASCHRIEQPLSNVRIQMLPPNTTAHLQPQDAGVIQSLKARIRAIKTRRVVVKVDELLERAAEVGVENMQAVTKSFFSADILEAMEWAEEAWKGVTSKTVANCWRHTAILDEDLCALIISMRGLRVCTPSI